MATKTVPAQEGSIRVPSFEEINWHERGTRAIGFGNGGLLSTMDGHTAADYLEVATSIDCGLCGLLANETLIVTPELQWVISFLVETASACRSAAGATAI